MQEEKGLHEGMGMHEMGMDGGMMGMMKMMMAVEHLDLTPDQRKKIQALRLQHQKEAIPLFGKIRMAGLETEELLMADPVDLEKVKARTKEKYEAMADLEMGHHQMQQQMKALLTPEQRQRLEEMMRKMGHGMGYGMDQKKKSPHEKMKPPTSSPGKPAPKMDESTGH
jgi:Spy/CpxP family protein refolding chaperone